MRQMMKLLTIFSKVQWQLDVPDVFGCLRLAPQLLITQDVIEILCLQKREF